MHAVVRIAAVGVANEEASSQHPALTRLPRDNAVCVVADHFWQAKRALEALDVVFDGGTQGDLSTAAIDALLQAALDGDAGVVAVETGTPRHRFSWPQFYRNNRSRQDDNEWSAAFIKKGGCQSFTLVTA